MTQKGFAQMDYVIAIGVFVIIFALVIQIVTNYFSNMTQNTNIRLMTSEATELLSVAENNFIPVQWPYFMPNESVLLYLHMDNSSMDSSRYGNNGTAMDGTDCSYNITGKIANACKFDGIDDYINTSNEAAFDFNRTPFTVAGWIKSVSDTSGIFISKGAGSNFQGWYVQAGRFVEVVYKNNLGTNVFRVNTTNSNYSINEWHHIAVIMTFDTANVTNNNATVYVDGSAAAMNQPVVTGGAPRLNDLGVEVGRRNNNGAGQNFFNGSIDDVIIYNRSLADSEIYELYAYENSLRRIGLTTKAYRINVRVNNTLERWYNQTLPWESISNELVNINFTDYGLTPDLGSVHVYDDNNNPASYQISGNRIIFTSNIPVNVTKNYTIYFDDDSSFPIQSVTQSGVNNLSEIVSHAERIDLIQYKKSYFINGSNYTLLKNSTGHPRDFRITIVDSNTSDIFLQYGGITPSSGNIVALRRFVLFQNSTGGIRRGYINVQVW